jgi:hypothetical protein
LSGHDRGYHRRCAAAFPNGGMTVSGLRREAAEGRLAISCIAGKQFTTLRAIREMIEARNPKEPAHGSSLPTPSRPPSGLSKTENTKRAQVAALAELEAAERKLREYLISKYQVP